MGNSLLPAEHMSLTVARGQIERGTNPEINVTTMLVMTIERLAGIRDYTMEETTATGWGIIHADGHEEEG